MTIIFIDTWPRHWNYHVSHACSLYRVDHSADHQHIQLDHDSLTVTDLNMKDLTMTDLTMTAWPWQQDHDSTNKLGHLKKWKTKKHIFMPVILTPIESLLHDLQMHVLTMTFVGQIYTCHRIVIKELIFKLLIFLLIFLYCFKAQWCYFKIPFTKLYSWQLIQSLYVSLFLLFCTFRFISLYPQSWFSGPKHLLTAKANLNQT